MKKNKKISFVIVFLLLDVLLCASLYFIMDATNINLLKKKNHLPHPAILRNPDFLS